MDQLHATLGHGPLSRIWAKPVILLGLAADGAGRWQLTSPTRRSRIAGRQ